MTRDQSNMAASATGTVVCAAVFVASLLYQFGLLEGVACLATSIQLFIRSATVADALEDKQASSRIRNLAAVLTAVLMMIWFGPTCWTHGWAS
jgi:bacteriorhodopsin